MEAGDISALCRSSGHLLTQRVLVCLVVDNVYASDSCQLTHRKVFPNVCVAVLPETLVVEAVDLRDLAGLVVAAQNRDALAKTDLKMEIEVYFLYGI